MGSTLIFLTVLGLGLSADELGRKAADDARASPITVQRLTTLYDAKAFDGVIAEAATLLQGRPQGETLAEALYWKGLAHAKRREWQAALVNLKSLLVLVPDSPRAAEAASTAALVHRARREPQAAAAVLADSARRRPRP